MRIIGVILVWVLLIGGISVYMNYQNAGRQAAGLTPEVKTETSSCIIEITSTFTVEADPFSLDSEAGNQGNGLILKLGQRVLPVMAENIQAGIPFRSDRIDDVDSGLNELYIQASPPSDDYTRHQAVRVAVMAGGRMIAEKTLWAEPGSTIAGTLGFKLADTDEEEEHDH